MPATQNFTGLALLAMAILAGCSGSANVTVENKIAEPVHAIVHPGGGMFVGTEGLEETIAPGTAVRGWMRVRLSPPFISLMDVERVGVQVCTGDSGPWWTGTLIDQTDYELRVTAGADGPAIEQRLDSRGLHGWRGIPLERAEKPWYSGIADRRIPAKSTGPLPD